MADSSDVDVISLQAEKSKLKSKTLIHREDVVSLVAETKQKHLTC